MVSKTIANKPLGPRVGALVGLGLALGLASACASTELFNEGPAQPSDRATGSVPAGSLGVCKRAGEKRPAIVGEQLWQDARPCTPSTPANIVRLGYGNDPAAEEVARRALAAIGEAAKDAKGRSSFGTFLRGLRDTASKDPALKDRVFHPSAAAGTCDVATLLGTMTSERAKLERGDRCSAYAYDAKLRGETCLFDASRDDVVWLTSAWPCVAHTGALGEEQSCYRLCAYDDYCARQVSCSAPDLELLLCMLGVCVPEAREAF